MGVNFNDYYRVTDAMALAPPSSPPPSFKGEWAESEPAITTPLGPTTGPGTD